MSFQLTTTHKKPNSNVERELLLRRRTNRRRRRRSELRTPRLRRCRESTLRVTLTGFTKTIYRLHKLYTKRRPAGYTGFGAQPKPRRCSVVVHTTLGVMTTSTVAEAVVRGPINLSAKPNGIAQKLHPYGAITVPPYCLKVTRSRESRVTPRFSARFLAIRLRDVAKAQSTYFH